VSTLYLSIDTYLVYFALYVSFLKLPFFHVPVQCTIYSCMTPERFELLNQLNFAWVVRATLERPRATWQQRLEELTEFHQTYGHFKVDPVTMPQLNKFCLDQRYRLRLLQKNDGKDVTKRMSPEREEALMAIGFTLKTELLEKHDGPPQQYGSTANGANDIEDVTVAKDDASQNDQTNGGNANVGSKQPQPEQDKLASV
jgi:hypothetical protein